MTRALVTGGTGFAGRYLVEHLAGLGLTVHATAHESHTSAPGAQVHPLDLRDGDAVARLVQEIEPDRIFHLAGVTRPASGDVRGFYDVNLGGACNVLEAVRIHAPEARTLVVGSGYAYAPSAGPIDETWPLAPENHYGASKAAAELVARAYAQGGLHVVLARPFNHSGPGQPPDFILPTIVEQVAAGRRAGQRVVTLRLGNLEPVRDISDVRDVVAGYVTALEHGCSGEAYNLGSGHGHSIRELVDLVASAAGVEVVVESDVDRVRSADVSRLVAQIDRMLALGWIGHRSIESTVRDMLAAVSVEA